MEQIKNKINIKKFTLKAMLYIAFLWWGYYALLVLSYIFSDCLDAILLFVGKISAIFNLNISYGNDEAEDFIFTTTYTPLIFSFFICYILAKLFGIFRFVDNLKINMFIKFILITIVSILSFLLLLLKLLYIDKAGNLSLPFAMPIFGLIPAFFLYKYFQYLTKKHPVPFKKIGYFFSIEFVKDVFNKVKQ